MAKTKRDLVTRKLTNFFVFFRFLTSLFCLCCNYRIETLVLVVLFPNSSYSITNYRTVEQYVKNTQSSTPISAVTC